MELKAVGNHILVILHQFDDESFYGTVSNGLGIGAVISQDISDKYREKFILFNKSEAKLFDFEGKQYFSVPEESVLAIVEDKCK